MSITYRELLEWLSSFSDSQLNLTATVYDLNAGEVFPVSNKFMVNKEDENIGNVLDEDHPVIMIG